MAKNSDQRAGDYETENTGGMLSGLLADEEHLDRRAMFRLGSWGAASVGAVIVAVLANQSGMNSRHDQIAALDLTRQSHQIQSVAKESQNETRRLASAIDTLNGDRDRLYSRLTGLEQGLESVTGAIAKQNVAPPPPATTPVTSGAPAASQPVVAAPEPAPAVAPVMTTATATTEKTATEKPPAEKTAAEKPRADAKKPAPPAAAPVAAAAPSSSVATTVPAAPPAPAPSNPPATTSAEPLMASKSLMSPPDVAAGKLIEPERSAKTAVVTPPPATPAPMVTPTGTAPDVAAPALAADKVAAAEPAPSASPPVAVKRTEFGVDVGGANSVGGLRALWRGLLKWRSSAPLAALQPIIVVKEGNNGLGMQLRLVAGPLTDAAAAARICASMTANDRHCETTVFDGQRLAMVADEAPATTESISARPSSEKTASEKTASEKTASEKPSSEKSLSEPASAKPGSSRQSSHRRGYSYAKRTATEEPPKQPPPPPSTLSWFHLRSQ